MYILFYRVVNNFYADYIRCRRVECNSVAFNPTETSPPTHRLAPNVRWHGRSPSRTTTTCTKCEDGHDANPTRRLAPNTRWHGHPTPNARWHGHPAPPSTSHCLAPNARTATLHLPPPPRCLAPNLRTTMSPTNTNTTSTPPPSRKHEVGHTASCPAHHLSQSIHRLHPLPGTLAIE